MKDTQTYSQGDHSSANAIGIWCIAELLKSLGYNLCTREGVPSTPDELATQPETGDSYDFTANDHKAEAEYRLKYQTSTKRFRFRNGILCFPFEDYLRAPERKDTTNWDVYGQVFDHDDQTVAALIWREKATPHHYEWATCERTSGKKGAEYMPHYTLSDVDWYILVKNEWQKADCLTPDEYFKKLFEKKCS